VADSDITEDNIKQYFVDLKKYVKDYIYNDPSTKPVLYTQGCELGTVKYYIQNLIDNCFIETADEWGLSIWEQEFGITPSENDTLEVRRNRLLARKQGWQTMTVDAIKNICNSFVDNTKIITHNEEYYFELQLENINKGFQNFLQDLIDIIEELKPAHLDAFYELVETIKSNFYIGTITYDGEILSTFPWTPNNINIQSNIYISATSFNNIETIIVYPSEAISKTLYSKLSDNTYKEMQFK
jgi:hypothetical protein